MNKSRMEAFSDGVIAIIITIMVLELRVPHGSDWEALKPLVPVMLSYVISFIYVGIYWNNHHHLLQAAKSVSGPILWANMHLLFWLSLIPFATTWMGENEFSQLPVAMYGFVLISAGLAYYILAQILIRHHGKESEIAKAIGRDKKGIISLIFYLLAISVAFIDTRISVGIYAIVAMIWLIPDRRLEKVLQK